MKENIGKTVLFSHQHACHDGRVLEGRVQKLSPNGKYVQIGKEWFEVGKVRILEILSE